jgi:thiamine kinase-like enzyme
MSSTRRLTRYFDNSNLALGGFVHVLSSERDEQILRIASELCPHLFSKSDQDDEKKEMDPSFEVKPLTGGLSNELFIVTRKDVSAPSVLVRIHPDEGEEDVLVNRVIENHLAAWLSEQGIAPAYYGRFKNGRIEEFYDNVTTLSSSTMANYAPKIAVIMAKFHSLNAPTEVLPKPSTTHQATFHKTMDDWLRKAFVLEQKMPNDNMELLTLLENEWKWLYSELQSTTLKDAVQLQALEFINQTVMTHMDGQSLNFLKDEKDDIRVIDFEYAAWNPRAVDIANTFCEYCDMNNICADFENEYPSDAQQNAFLIPYIRQAQPSLAEQMDQDEIWAAAFLATIRQEIGRFSLVSHLNWATWSVIKSKEDSGINFDYIKYAHHRMDGYQFAKKKFFDQRCKL